jgi:hypothetical protein
MENEEFNQAKENLRREILNLVHNFENKYREVYVKSAEFKQVLDINDNKVTKVVNLDIRFQN